MHYTPAVTGLALHARGCVACMLQYRHSATLKLEVALVCLPAGRAAAGSSLSRDKVLASTLGEPHLLLDAYGGLHGGCKGDAGDDHPTPRAVAEVQAFAHLRAKRTPHGLGDCRGDAWLCSTPQIDNLHACCQQCRNQVKCSVGCGCMGYHPR